MHVGWQLCQRAMLAIGATAVIALGACGHHESAPSLSFEMPARFRASASTKPAMVGAWWTELRSPELNRLVARADIDNLDIAIAVAQLEASLAQVEIAGAALWPVFNYNDTNTRSRSSGTGTPGRILSASQRNSFAKAINASYALDVWGQNRDLLDAALHTASASSYQIEVVRLTALATLVNNYIAYAAAQERIEVARRNLANAERVLGVIRERKAAGTASDFDEAQQGTLVETLRANIALLRQTAEAARLAIALAVGKPVQTVDLRIANLKRLRVPTVSPDAPVTLLVRRPDVRNLEQQLAAADADVVAARKAFLPVVQLTGQIGYQSALLSTLFRPESLIFQAAANATQVIFDGGRLRGQLALTEAQRNQLLESYRRTVLQALVDVENALVAIRESAAREVAQRKAVELAREAFTLGEERLRQGTIDLTTLLTTQNTLIQAEDALIQARLARLQAVVSLYQALGGGWDEADVPVPVAH